MIVVRNRFGQLEPEVTIAAGSAIGPFKLSHLFLMSVAAGVTVWFLTRWLDRTRS